MPTNSIPNDKTTFIVAFFAAFIALNFYSDFFFTIKLLFGTYEYSLNMVFNLMLTSLFISVYFFALDYIKPDSSYKWKIFLFFKMAGNFFYALTMVILPISLIIYGTSYIFINMNVKPESLNLIFGGIFSFIGGLIANLFAGKITRQDKEKAVGVIQHNEENAIKQAEELYKGGFNSAALVEIGKLIEIALQKALLTKRNIDIKRAGLGELINIALKTELIDSEMANSIIEIRNMRNKAAHMDIEFKKEDAELAIKETNQILQKLDPKTQWN